MSKKGIFDVEAMSLRVLSIALGVIFFAIAMGYWVDWIRLNNIIVPIAAFAMTLFLGIEPKMLVLAGSKSSISVNNSWQAISTILMVGLIVAFVPHIFGLAWLDVFWTGLIAIFGALWALVLAVTG